MLGDEVPGVGGVMVRDVSVRVRRHEIAQVIKIGRGFGVGLGALRELANVMQEGRKGNPLDLLLLRQAW
jgi:hypothetical protein